MKFLDLFEEIRIDEEYVMKSPNTNAAFVEFPLCFFNSTTAYSLPGPNRIPERHIESDYIAVPLFDEVQTEMDAARLVAATGVDRNMLAYDKEVALGEFSLELVNLMKQVMKRNGGGNTIPNRTVGLTDLFISEKIHPTEEEICGVKIHPINIEFWNELEKYYKDSLGGSYGEMDGLDKANIVIGVSTDGDTFIRPIRKLNGSEGLAVLSNQKVLLGLV
jgi:hypothetical protein